MSDNLNNQAAFELLDAALRRDVPPEEPMPPKLQAGILASIRAESGVRGGVLTPRRFAVVIGAGALAAGVLLAIALLVMSPLGVNSPTPIAPNTEGGGGNIFVNIPPPPAIVDNSTADVEESAADSLVREMQYLARDASDIGSAMLASLPVDVVGGGQGRWWTKLLDK